MSTQSSAPASSDRPPADDGFKLLRHMARKGEVELKKAQESTLIVIGDRYGGILLTALLSIHYVEFETSLRTLNSQHNAKIVFSHVTIVSDPPEKPH
jgi:hypothetical protein